MASPQAGRFRPVLHLGIFAGLVVLLYGLVLAPGAKTPKLGIDLQGGTRITLAAQTLDGSTPTREAMQQARTIMETRVNGSGVVGAQVQLDGASQLVVTVPGKSEDLGGLARSAIMNIRPVAGGSASPQLFPMAAPTEPTATTGSTSGSRTSGSAVSGSATLGGSTSGSGASGSGVSGSPAPSSAEPSTLPAIGETLTSAPASGSSATPPASVGPVTTAPAGSGGATSGGATSAQGLRGAAAAASTPNAAAASTTPSAPAGSAAGSGERTASAAGTSTAGTSTAGTSAAGTSAAGSGSGTTGSGTTGSGTTGSGSTTAGGATGTAAANGAFPTIKGGDPRNPTQPQGTDQAAFTAWQSAAAASIGTGQLTCADLGKFQGLDDPKKPLLACDEKGTVMYILEPTLIPGSQVSGATAGIGQSGGWAINLQFNQTGFGTWASYTAGHVKTLTAFTLDGQVLSAPSISGPINTPTTEVSGSFNQASATSLANSLKFGALPLKFNMDKTDDVSAEVGADSLRAGLIAGGIGLLLVVLYCLFYYRLLGVVTILSLVLSGVLVYAVMVLLGRWIDLSLDMSGVAGLIIAIGITADSFVVYFERLKDEVREGRTFRSAVPRGWERAKRTILSADAVTLLSAIILYVLAVGDVKGFAFTLGLSTVLDLVVVFLVTHPLVSLAADARAFRSPKLSGLGAVAAAGARHRAAASHLAVKEA